MQSRAWYRLLLNEEFEAAKADLIAQLKDAGAEESVEWWSNAWAEAKTTIEGMTK